MSNQLPSLETKLRTLHDSFMSLGLERSSTDCHIVNFPYNNRVIYLFGETTHYTSNLVDSVNDLVIPQLIKFPESFLIFKEGYVEGKPPSTNDGPDIQYFTSLSMITTTPMFGLGVEIDSPSVQDAISANLQIDVDYVRAFYLQLLETYYELLELENLDYGKDLFLRRKFLDELRLDTNDLSRVSRIEGGNKYDAQILQSWNDLIREKFVSRLEENSTRRGVIVCVGESHVPAFDLSNI